MKEARKQREPYIVWFHLYEMSKMGKSVETESRLVERGSEYGVSLCVLNRLVMSNSFVTPLACSSPGSSVPGISQARILEWVAISSSRGSSQPKDPTGISWVSCTGRQIYTTEPPGKPRRVSLQGDETAQELVVRVARLCKYTKKPLNYTFEKSILWYGIISHF